MKWRLPEEPSPASEVDIRATWSTPILSASSVASVYCNSTNNMVAWQKKKQDSSKMENNTFWVPAIKMFH